MRKIDPELAGELTEKQLRLIEAGHAIEVDEAKRAGFLGFMARVMAQASLPHSAVEGAEYRRVNGDFVLSIMTPQQIGLPYGSIPRVLLTWISTEAVRTQCRDLELGKSLSVFMGKLGMSPTGGANGSINRLKTQSRSLFASTISTSYQGTRGTIDAGFRIAKSFTLDDAWWSAVDAGEGGGVVHDGGQPPVLTLSADFFEELLARPVPLDLRAVAVLKSSALDLDLYIFLTYRASYLRAPTTIPWGLLAEQFGTGYARVRDFKAAVKESLKKIYAVYPDLKAEVTDEGLKLRPGRTHVRRLAP
jgi:hypothetical protein